MAVLMKLELVNSSARLGDEFKEFINYAICKLKNEFALPLRGDSILVERNALFSVIMRCS
jgi:hypothetical protein